MPANYVLLQRIELNASAASVVFNNIPQSGYTDLKVVISARTTGTDPDDYIIIKPNNSTSNLTYRWLRGTGSAVASGTTERPYVNAGGSTANTFGNLEIYFPNYTSSNFKSFSIDAATENNATDARLTLNAHLWSDTTAISSLVFASGQSFNFVANSTFSLYGLAAVGTTPVIAPKATGGNITTDGTYWIHTFLSTGTFTPLQGLTCDYLVVAGGGGGGRFGGGGGAGGLRSTVTATGGGGSLESALSVASGTAYTITVGAGGAGSTVDGTAGTNGVSSVFSTITSVGGGGGGSYDNNNAAIGGSGGGAANSTTSKTGAAGTTNQGYAGGNNSTSGPGYPSGGGGGAGALGGNGSGGSQSGNGGNGVATSISGTSTTYAGGGGGGINSFSGGAGTGGSGGGGTGGLSNAAGTSGTTNLGGGGGGGGLSANGGAGGSGIVIIRYPIA